MDRLPNRATLEELALILAGETIGCLSPDTLGLISQLSNKLIAFDAKRGEQLPLETRRALRDYTKALLLVTSVGALHGMASMDVITRVLEAAGVRATDEGTAGAGESPGGDQ